MLYFIVTIASDFRFSLSESVTLRGGRAGSNRPISGQSPSPRVAPWHLGTNEDDYSIPLSGDDKPAIDFFTLFTMRHRFF
jgi:hypothetical protein